ncbi:MAG: hypothetical protein HY376_01865 [Candidatus Blackburnbacteria bacterium]|nr:hypothetical protein [Candidatus Blackburnbacteria bacterium]
MKEERCKYCEWRETGVGSSRGLHTCRPSCHVRLFVEGAGEFYCNATLPCSKHTPQKRGMKTQSLTDIATETAERIVIDYANFSGRDSSLRAQLRESALKHITQALAQREKEERNAWLEGRRCFTCGNEMEPKKTTDTCDKCLEES